MDIPYITDDVTFQQRLCRAENLSFIGKLAFTFQWNRVVTNAVGLNSKTTD